MLPTKKLRLSEANPTPFLSDVVIRKSKLQIEKEEYASKEREAKENQLKQSCPKGLVMKFEIDEIVPRASTSPQRLSLKLTGKVKDIISNVGDKLEEVPSELEETMIQNK